MNRRQFISTVATAALGGAALRGHASESPLIYLSPIKPDGTLSSCQAEVWFVHDGADFLVVTADDAWRARAVERGLTQTRIWVGDVGMWDRAGGRHLELPELVASASVERDGAAQAAALERFGEKYADEWGSWGPRFRRGLADGSRVMLRYQPTTL